MVVSPPQSGIAIVGSSCRLPGAPSRAAFGRLLESGTCSVRSRPTGRWSVERFLHPNPSAAGFSYSFAGGYIDDLFDFDPSVFGMSPREVMEADPQQRLLLETVFEALEDAWIPRDSLSGTDVGVYVGASSLDHGAVVAADPAAIDRYFMTGNTLSIFSNRLSHNFNWHGPSFTVDTACSSSLVAFTQAISDLSAGRIDTAIVAGVNVLLNPIPFVGFSRARMLSQSGLSRPFSRDADGYVRGEGAVALVLRRGDVVVPGSARAWVVGGGINNDGRTSGIALPNMQTQAKLLEDVYRSVGIAPDDLAFVEAHGTGTQVGDAIEATALGTALGKHRSRPLPIGSVKSNLGHLEPASGVAGILKALHALETRRLPASLHIDMPNPNVDFDALGLAPASCALDLGEGTLFCGVSSFGFGGTNAHIVLKSAKAAPAAAPAERPDYLVLSAATREALAQTARAHADLIASGHAPGDVAAAVAMARETMSQRVVVPIVDAEKVEPALRAFAGSADSVRAFEGSSADGRALVCFAFSGNGALTVDLTRAAFNDNAVFRKHFRGVAEVFAAQGVESLETDLFDEGFEQRKASAIFLQPLMYALQYSAAAALIDAGIVPDVVLGHSLGEVAAATIAGAITRDEAARIILTRSTSQERVRGMGGMAVFSGGATEIAALIAEIGQPKLEIAAENSPSSVTVTGPVADVKALVALCRRARIAGRLLDLEYPFHSSLLDDLEPLLKAGLSSLRPTPVKIPFISTVTGALVGEKRLDTAYWWDNFRQPVAFRRAVESASAFGATLFIEISQYPILLSPIRQTLAEIGSSARVIASLVPDNSADAVEPVSSGIARALANGAEMMVSAAPDRSLSRIDRTLGLPHYAWQKKWFHFEGTVESIDVFGSDRKHPLIGERLFKGSQEWRGTVDAALVPYLADHVVDGEVVMPGSSLVEMMLAAGREIRGGEPLVIEDLDILQAVTLPGEMAREISVRHAPTTGMIEVLSRARLGAEDWVLNARGRLAPAVTQSGWSPPDMDRLRPVPVEGLYRKVHDAGMHYGPAFQRLRGIMRDGWTILVHLDPIEDREGYFKQRQLLHPASVDACFHALLTELKNDSQTGKRAYLPIRFGRVSLVQDHADIVSAVLQVQSETDDLLVVSAVLLDAGGQLVARIDKALFRSVVFSQGDEPAQLLHVELWPERTSAIDAVSLLTDSRNAGTNGAVVLLEAHMRAVAYRALRKLAGPNRRLSIEKAAASGLLAVDAVSYAEMLLSQLQASGLASLADDGTWLLSRQPGLPAPERILATFAAEHPSASPELMLAVGTMAGVDGYLAQGQPLPHRDSVVRRFAAGTLLLGAAAARVGTAIERLIETDPQTRPRVLLFAPQGESFSDLMIPLAAAGRIRLALAGRNSEELALAAMHLPRNCRVQLVDLCDETLHAGRFDLAVFNVFNAPADLESLAEQMGRRLSQHGALIVAHASSSPLYDFYFGTRPGWFSESVSPVPFGLRPHPEEVVRRLGRTALADVQSVVGGGLDAQVIVVGKPPVDVVVKETLPLRIVCREGPATRLAGCLRRFSDGLSRRRTEVVCLLSSAPADGRAAVEDMMDMAMKALAADDGKSRFWLVTRCAFGVETDASAEALWAFGRVLMNEYPDHDIRLVDCSRDIGDEQIAARLHALIVNPGAEREIHLGASGRSAVRVVPAPRLPAEGTQGWRLRQLAGRGLSELTWHPADRRAPGPDEIEIAVEAAGLNFRDVMLAMGLLFDDVLEGGAAGATLGFECAGRVAAVGSNVQDLAPGDLVCGIASQAFATHVTAPRRGFVPVPNGLDAERAATLPVAFLTAWYGLLDMARLKPGETVLIHGAAGGVGLAAIQVARARRARVVATVSTPDKEALVRMLGVEHVYDSRSLDFHARIAEEFGGVDVVLNSLAGNAMRAGLKCLKPFGRFVELGKRDYVANTELGLRPFRRNLSYFGVDIDQLFAADPGTVNRGLSHIVKGFESGRYDSLPYLRFQGEFVADAMRLMQSAGHVGKILICPPAMPLRASIALSAPDAKAGFRPAEGVQLVVGGAGGFGFATALWLAEKGATHVVLASRRGELDPDAAAQAGRFADLGTSLTVLPLDVSDSAGVAAFVDRVAETVGPISGVYHAAVVSDDGVVANLTTERISRVLAPKIDGAINLDAATRHQPVRDFVLFSSGASLVGNPGQAAYSAANAFMHGIVRRRRQLGLPGLAVGWGAISDVGMIARNTEISSKIERLAGAGILAAEAHAVLEDLLRQGPSADPVAYFGRLHLDGAARSLPVVQAPTFSLIRTTRPQGDAVGETDLAGLLAGKSAEEALPILTEMIIAEVATILRIAVSDVDDSLPLVSLGLDSLMALELRMSVEAKFGLDLPLMAITSVQNLRDLAKRMLEMLQSQQSGVESETSELQDALYHMHGGKGDADDAPVARRLRGR